MQIEVISSGADAKLPVAFLNLAIQWVRNMYMGGFKSMTFSITGIKYKTDEISKFDHNSSPSSLNSISDKMLVLESMSKLNQ